MALNSVPSLRGVLKINITASKSPCSLVVIIHSFQKILIRNLLVAEIAGSVHNIHTRSVDPEQSHVRARAKACSRPVAWEREGLPRGGTRAHPQLRDCGGSRPAVRH